MNGISSSRKALTRLAGVGGLEVGELVGVLLDRVGELEQRELALARRGRRPGVEGAARGAPRGRRPRPPDSGASAIASPVAGLRTGSVSPVGGVDELAVDEVLQDPGCCGHEVLSFLDLLA